MEDMYTLIVSLVVSWTYRPRERTHTQVQTEPTDVAFAEKAYQFIVVSKYGLCDDINV